MIHPKKNVMPWVGLLLALSIACQRSATKVQEYPPQEETKPRPVLQETSTSTLIPQEASEPEPPRELIFENIQFDFDKYALTDQAREILVSHAGQLRENPQVTLLIEGHCDEWGTIEYNLALGEKRAITVKQYLVNYGIDASRLSTISYGKERPLDTARNEQAWAKNRRATFIMSEGGNR